MALFKDMLKSDQTLFRDPIALDYDYVPKILPFRDTEQHAVAACMKPLFASRNARNTVVTGRPGIGKTVACKHILRELEKETDDIYTVFVSCWQKSSSFKIMVGICEQLGYKMTHNKRTDELFGEIKRIVNKKSVVFVFDEIDKADDFDFLYMILEEVYKKSIIMITNYPEWISELDERIRSRLTPEVIEFRPYSLSEVNGILSERIKYALYDNVIQNQFLAKIAQKTHEGEDLRTGLFLIRESAENAEARSSTKIEEADVEKALFRMTDFKKKKCNDLEDDLKNVLSIVKKYSGGKIGDIFKEYQKNNPDTVYKTFQRKVRKLADGGFVSTKAMKGGKEGTTTIVSFDSTKKLTEF